MNVPPTVEEHPVEDARFSEAMHRARVVELTYLTHTYALILGEALDHITPNCDHGLAWLQVARDHAQSLSESAWELMDLLDVGRVVDPF